MSFSAPWDETKPAGSRNLNLGDDDIREFKTQVRERNDVDGYFPSTDDGSTGYHRKATLMKQVADPTQVVDALILYSKNDGSYSELYSRHENAASQKLTLNGKLWIAALTMAGLAQGDVLYFDGTVINRLGAGTSGQFLKTQGASANPAWSNVSGSFIQGLFRNLVVTRPSTHTVTLTADEVLADDGSGNVQRFTAVNLTCDIEAAAGAGGLSTGAEAANTIYYLWLVAKTDGTKALVLDPSATAPTLPSGYTYRALMSCVGNDNSSNFINFRQRGLQYSFAVWATMASGNVGTGSWVAIDLTPANMTTNAGFVPSALSTKAFGAYTGASAAAAMTNDNGIAASATSFSPNKLRTGGGNELVGWEFDTITSETLYWVSADASSIVYLHGFYMDKLV